MSMGKKSKAKKIHHKEAEVSEANKKIKKTEEKKPRIQINKKKLFGSVLVVIMLSILVSAGYLLFQKAFRAEPIAKLLPEDSTVAILEINTNFEHNQIIKAFNLLKNQEDYNKEKLIGDLEKWLSVSYENDMKPWLGRQIGVAIINSKKEKGSVDELYFAEFISKPNVDKFLAKYNPSENVYTGQKTYMITDQKGAQKFVTFINNYIFFSPTEQAIYQLLDSQKSSDKVYGSKKYREIDSGLPLNRTAFFYVNFDQVNDGFFQHFPFLSESGISSKILQPFFKTFDAEGATLIAMDDNFAIQSFLNIDPEIVDNAQYLSFQKKYDAQLAKYMSPDILAFWGGENLEYQLKKVIELLAGGDGSTLTLFDRILQNYTQKYFGQEADFKEDVLPFFQNEFAIVFEKINEKNNYKLLFELESPQSDAVKLHQLADSFATVGAIFEPKVNEYKLQDGTAAKEIVAVPEEIIKTETNYENITIYELKIGKEKGGIYYSIIDNVAVVADSIDSVKNTIDLAKDKKPNLRASKLFFDDIEPILNSSDEVAYFNIDAVLPSIFKQKPAPKILNIIDSLSSGRNYFNDGVMTINYLHIK